MYIYAYIHTHIYIYIYIRVSTYIYTYAHIMCVHMHTHTCIQTYTRRDRQIDRQLILVAQRETRSDPEGTVHPRARSQVTCFQKMGCWKKYV